MNFDVVAGVYDFLTTIVFGKNWPSVQKAPLHYIKPHDRVLIVGGGTGVILDRLDSQKVTFLDVSVRMLAVAKKRNTNAKANITFISADFLSHSFSEQFDVIVFPFFLDCFSEYMVNQIINRAKGLMTPQSRLIITDFQKSSWWRNMLVAVMYLFFRLTSGLEANRLPGIKCLLREQSFEPVDERLFYKGWVFCSSFRKR